ncbi:MAG: leucine-rich repeat protein, partial [Lachnospiraceae bacterium]|nr:leucine-rich repeat protein [Lachnospiraceae bacterium]
MKKSGRKVLSVILTAVMVFILLPIISFPMRAKAETNTTSDGLFDYMVDDNNRVDIKKYKGTNPDVVIPKEIEGMPVCFIDNQAFNNSKDFLNTIVFEGDVEIIEDSAFAECIFLQSVEFKGNVKNIGEMAF